MQFSKDIYGQKMKFTQISALLEHDICWKIWPGKIRGIKCTLGFIIAVV